MITSRADPRDAGALSPQDLELMLRGPRAIGCDLWSPEADHGRLRAVWAQHQAAIVAEAARRGIGEIWFVSRDWFVALVEGP